MPARSGSDIAFCTIIPPEPTSTSGLWLGDDCVCIRYRKNTIFKVSKAFIVLFNIYIET